MPGGISGLPGAVLLQSGAGTTQATVDPAFKSLRVSSRPAEFGTRGHYRMALNWSETAAQAAGASLFSLRWGDATRLMAIYAVRLMWLQTLAFTATTPILTNLNVARSFTASDTIGSAISFAGNNQKDRTSHASSLITDSRVSTVAAGLTAGTRTLDAQPILSVVSVGTITNVNGILYQNGLDLTGPNAHPIVLAQNEGIVLLNAGNALPAAGTANLSIELSWAEVDAY